MEKRYHSLDNLRGLIMWLGVVIHVCVNHLDTPFFLPWRDPQTTILADLLLLWLHVFRMPVFFILAGFFAFYLVEKRGLRLMLRNRFMRICVPFMIFWPILLGLTMLLIYGYLSKMMAGPMPLTVANTEDQSPINTMHLWFLYYLMWFYPWVPLFVRLREKLSDPIKARGLKVFHVLATSWWSSFVLAIPLAFIGSHYDTGMVQPDGQLIPNIFEYTHYWPFFLFGWVLFIKRDEVLDHFRATWVRSFALGTLMFLVSLYFLGIYKTEGISPYFSLTVAYVYNCATWFYCFAVFGIFCRFLDKENSKLRYLSDSSYWVYLVHMLGTIGFGMMLFDLQAPAIVKIVINIVLTSVVSLFTYHYFVRFTRIGKLLNGRAHTKKMW